MEGRIGLLGWVSCFVLYVSVFVIPFWRIFKKAGFSPWLSLPMPIPLLNVAMCFFLGFARWPNTGASK
jgi:hypothetical protein